MGILKHGHDRRRKRTRTYRVWNNMIVRCKYSYADNYKRYGGLGIFVCDRWKTFTNFLADMGEVPTGKTLDRINSFGNYEPNNCRWATPTEQATNQKSNVRVEFRGRTQNISTWAREFGLHYHALYWRIVKAKWPIEKALTTTSQRKRKV
jgi:hypothetical protein